MVTLVRQPGSPSQTTKLDQGVRRYYTLHIDKHVFTIQKNGTSVVAFRNKNDAIRFGKLIESHFDVTHTWPIINFDDPVFLRTYKNSRLKYLDMKDWHADKLQSFCIENYFSMLDIHNFVEDDSFRLVGNSVFWEAPMSMYIDMLNGRIEDSI